MTKKTRKTYSDEFKREAVRLADSSAKPVSQVERELEVSQGLIRKWRRALREDGSHAFPGQGNPSPEQARILELEKKLARVTEEREILKKAVGIFSKAQH